MGMIPETVLLRQRRYLSDGKNSATSLQLAWADFFEPRESLSGGRSYIFHCKDCQLDKNFGAVDSIRNYIYEHTAIGHKTTFRRI